MKKIERICVHYMREWDGRLTGYLQGDGMYPRRGEKGDGMEGPNERRMYVVISKGKSGIDVQKRSY